MCNPMMMTMTVEYGALGALLILAGWIFETFEAVKHHHALIDLRFAAIYAVGNFFLIIYSWLVADYVFFALSVMILLIVMVEIAYTVLVTGRRGPRARV